MTSTVQPSWLAGPSANTSTAGLVSYLGIDWARVTVALLLCLAIGTITVFVVRARILRAPHRDSSAAPRIRVVEHARLTPRTMLHMIEYDQRVVLLMSDATGTKVVDAHTKPTSES
ncbi:hypothetical protein [Burkholderia ubonensis]|uniref:hypothetical protein n=1 Tax=Burkholderia ubonensis TaxID=101571 RepID=UPI0007598E09|nr:hypothetical protein [Burkholderia ubonensis]KWN10650.1 hypothetical protein WM21_22195 [Burkholderia ubonensis]